MNWSPDVCCSPAAVDSHCGVFPAQLVSLSTPPDRLNSFAGKSPDFEEDSTHHHHCLHHSNESRTKLYYKHLKHLLENIK